jgi:hypothetical protein
MCVVYKISNQVGRMWTSNFAGRIEVAIGTAGCRKNSTPETYTRVQTRVVILMR